MPLPAPAGPDWATAAELGLKATAWIANDHAASKLASCAVPAASVSA